MENITSFDPNKTWIIKVNDKKNFFKKTTQREVDMLLFAKKNLENNYLNINNKYYSLEVPTIISWNSINTTLEMSFCEGNNLEYILRNPETHEYGVAFLQKILFFMLDNNFYWIDFAPRNILLGDKKIFLVDFEKGIDSINIKIQDFLRNHVYEEYGSFLFEHERVFLPDYVFSMREDEVNDIFKIEDIGPKRIKATAKALGYNDTITKQQYLEIVKMFIIAEEPFEKSGLFVFPRIELEHVLKDKLTNPKAYDNYAREIIERNKIHSIKKRSLKKEFSFKN